MAFRTSSPGLCRSVPSAHTMLDTACGFTSRVRLPPWDADFPFSSRSRPATMSSRSCAPGSCSSRAHAHPTLASPCEFMRDRLARTRSMRARKEGDPVMDSRVASPFVCVAMRWMAVAV